MKRYALLPLMGLVVGAALGFTVAASPPLGGEPTYGLGFFGALFGAGIGLLSGSAGSLTAYLIQRARPTKQLIAGLWSGIAAAIVALVPALIASSNDLGSPGWISWVPALSAFIGCALVIGLPAKDPKQHTPIPS